MDVLVLPVGDEFYAVPLGSVREVMPRPRPTSLPTAPVPVLGLINVRGEIVPLFDIPALLGTGTTRQVQFAAIVEIAAGAAGLAATSAPTSEMLGEQVGAAEPGSTSGLYTQGSRLATLLDLEAVLSEIR